MTTTNIQLLRSKVAHKRPAAAPLLDGQAVVNYNAAEPGLFFRLTDGTLTKIGPAAMTEDGSRPNSAPAGQTGNSIGEQWLNASPLLSRPALYVFNGSEFVTSSGFLIDEPTGDYTLGANLTANGLAVLGDSNLGQSCADTLTVTATAEFNCPVTFNDDVFFNGQDITFGQGCGVSTLTFNGEVVFNCDAIPTTDNAINLGSPTNRFANIYTGDLHLRNDRGDWTIIEESEELTITNNKTGKRYAFVLKELG